MIGKIGKKREHGKGSFKDLIEYCLHEHEDNPGRVLYAGSQNVLSVDTAIYEMEALASENTRSDNPVFHAILSWPSLEMPAPEQVDEAVKITLKELDLQDCQAVWALHGNTENPHVHIAVNRIDPETTRAIQPAANWTHEAIQRASRKIEIVQGWQIEQRGMYVVTPEGEIKKKSSKEQPSITQAAQDMEAHTGQKSAERIGQEIAAPILRSSQSWNEAHQRLAAEGITYERQGSGAVLKIGDAEIRASKAGRDCSLSKLEARFGIFQKADNDVQIEQRAPEPVERIERQPQVKKSWEDYTKARSEYYRNKKDMTAVMQSRHKNERLQLVREQREERSVLFAASWKGKGNELNRLRSTLAATQQAIKLDLYDRQGDERNGLKTRFPSRFPNFKSWLQQEENPELEVLYRHSGDHTMIGKTTVKPHEHEDIRDYSPAGWSRGHVAYSRNNGKRQEAEFVDYGRKILLSKKLDETAVLAALQLANQKWGAAEINGSDEYKRLCIDVAIKHGLKISNPDLRLEVEAGQKQLFETTAKAGGRENAIEESKMTFQKYADAIGAEKYRVVVTKFTDEGVEAFVYDQRHGGVNGKTAAEISDAIPKFEQYDRNGRNINVVPLSPDKHYIIIDDMTTESLEELKKDGYRPACVVESSPHNFQAILTVPSLEGDREKDHAAASRLTRALNTRYGDPKLAGSVHAHRLPPFRNQKPKHRRENGTFPATRLVESAGGECLKAAEQLLDIQKQLSQEISQERKQRTRSASIPIGFERHAIDPTGAYWAHYRDVIGKQKGDLDYSVIDGMIGIRMRVTGYSADQVQKAIEENAPAMRKDTMSAQEYDAKYRSRDWKRFAKETTEQFVFGPRGIVQYGKAEQYRAYFMKVEGRNMAAERREQQEWQRSIERTRGKRQDRGR